MFVIVEPMDEVELEPCRVEDGAATDEDLEHAGWPEFTLWTLS